MRTIVDLQDYSELDYNSIAVGDYSYLDASGNLLINFTKSASQSKNS